MRVLVTGSTGFVGSHLTEELCKRGFDVNVLIRRRWSGSLPSWLNHTNIIYGDVADATSVEAAVKSVDVVFHLASLLGRWQSEYTEAEYSQVNVTGTKLLVAASKKENVQHFIHLSTAGVMGRLVNVPADETHPLGPEFPYEQSKYLAELALKASMKKTSSLQRLSERHTFMDPEIRTPLKFFS
jgi:nucleoside-diphosphate-sugar epimerase